MKVIQSRSCDRNNVLCMSDPHNLPQFRSKIIVLRQRIKKRPCCDSVGFLCCREPGAH